MAAKNKYAGGQAGIGILVYMHSMYVHVYMYTWMYIPVWLSVEKCTGRMNIHSLVVNNGLVSFLRVLQRMESSACECTCESHNYLA